LLQELATAAAGDAHHQPRARRASDETLAVHAGEKLGKKGADVGGSGTGTETDSIATPIVSGTTHWFKSSEDLIAFKEGRRHSFEYGRYSNPTVKVLEDKISALERAEATLVTSSGMNAITTTLLALVPPGGHVVTTTDCYSEARAFIRDKLSRMGIRSTFIDLDDGMESLKAVLDENDDVTLFYADSPTNPTLKCVDIRHVAELCHRKAGRVPWCASTAPWRRPSTRSRSPSVLTLSCTPPPSTWPATMMPSPDASAAQRRSSPEYAPGTTTSGAPSLRYAVSISTVNPCSCHRPRYI
jgi:cystathionine gamma-synthase